MRELSFFIIDTGELDETSIGMADVSGFLYA